MKNFMRAIFASAMFYLALNFVAFSANAQTPPASSNSMPSATDAVPPVTVQPPAPTNAAPVPPPADGIKVPTDQQATPTLAPAPKAATHKAKKSTKHVASKSKHHAKKKAHAKSKKKAVMGSAREHVRTAQTNLDTLNYNPGPIDGLVGPKTRAAIKAFQKDHSLKVTGKLDSKTYDLLASEAADIANKKKPLSALENGGEVPPGPQPQPEFFAKNPDYYGYYNREYANPNQMGSPQAIPTRYGDMQISDQMAGTIHQYVITINGQAVFHADGQPAVINLSRTFALEGADAIVLTSYAAGDATCQYRHYLLIVRLNSNGVHEIGNCTRSYEAYTQSGSLYITFPGDHVDGWSTGDSWRYENGTLQRL